MANWPYSTRRWKGLRRQKLRLNPVCEYCRRAGAAHVDHVQAINNGGAAWSLENLRSACASCHNRKTRYSEQLNTDVPVKGCDPVTGMPLDSKHWWHATAEKNCSQLNAGDRRRTFSQT